jgi:hypothetical protein
MDSTKWLTKRPGTLRMNCVKSMNSASSATLGDTERRCEGMEGGGVAWVDLCVDGLRPA